MEPDPPQLRNPQPPRLPVTSNLDREFTKNRTSSRGQQRSKKGQRPITPSLSTYNPLRLNILQSILQTPSQLIKAFRGNGRRWVTRGRRPGGARDLNQFVQEFPAWETFRRPKKIPLNTERAWTPSPTWVRGFPSTIFHQQSAIIISNYHQQSSSAIVNLVPSVDPVNPHAHQLIDAEVMNPPRAHVADVFRRHVVNAHGDQIVRIRMGITQPLQLLDKFR